MWIADVKLRDVRKHEEFEVCLSPGVVLFLGANGAGKSSVLMAINYALFGELPVKVADFVRVGAASAHVEVSFVTDERYTVQRSTGGRYRLSCGRKVLSDGKVDTEATLKSLLGLRPDVSLSALCRDALSVPQGGLTDGFGLPDKARFEHWARLLRLDEWRRAWEALRPAARLLEDRKAKAEAEAGVLEDSLRQFDAPDDLSGVLSDTEAQIAQLQSEKKRLSGLCESLRVKATEATIALAARRADEAQLVKVEVAIDSLRAELARKSTSLVGELEKLRGELAGLKIDPSLGGKVKRSAEKLATDWAEVHRIAADRRRVKEVLEIETGKLEEAKAAEEDILRLKALLLEKREAQAETAKIIVLSQGEIECARIGQRDTREGEPCPICGAKLSAQRVAELRVEFASAIERAKTELERAERERTYSAREISSLQCALEKAQAKVALAAPDRVDDLKSERERLTKELRAAEDAAVAASEAHNALERAGEANEAAVKKSSELRAAIARLEAQEAARRDDVDRLEAGLCGLESEKVDLSISLAVPLPESKEKELGAAVISLARVEEELVVQCEALKDWRAVEQLTARLFEARASVVAAEGSIRRLAGHRSVMDAAGPLLAERVTSRLSALAGEYWQNVGRDGGLRWDKDFVLSLDGKAFGLLSGGEQVIAALVCRLAVAHWLASLDWLVLDEPTVHLDEQARLGLAEAIGQAKLEQVLVVSHDDTFASVAGQVVRL